MLSPFLNRSELSLLIGKIRFPDQKSNPSKADAQKHVLRELAIPESAIHMFHDSGESFLTTKQEQGFAILNYLRREVEEIEEGETVAHFTNDEWFMRQLIIFLENEGAVKDILFARSGIKEEQGPKRMTTRTFTEDRKLPYRIRHNTIEIRVKNDNEQKGVLGVSPLKYLVLAVLNGEPINDFLLETAFPPLLKAPKKSREWVGDKDLKVKISERIKFLCESLDEKPKRLQPQIRFIAGIINKTCQKKNKALNAGEYKNIENLVRYFRKESLLDELKRLDILNNPPAQCNAEKFSDLIDDNGLEAVYRKIRESHLQWLKQQSSSLDVKSTEDLRALANELNVRGIPAENPPEEFSPFPRPTGLTVKTIKENFFPNSEWEDIVFFNLVRNISQGVVFEQDAFGISLVKENYKSSPVPRHEKKRRLENWARASLLWNMVKHSLKETLTRQQQLNIFSEQKFSLDGLEINIQIKQKFKVVCDFKKGWRDYARYSTNYLKKILDAYAPNETQVNLLRSNQSGTSKSVQGIIEQIQSERFTAMRAILLWEKGVVDEHKLTPKPSENFVDFEHVMKATNVKQADRESLTQYRNNVMHGKIGDNPLSEVPQDLKPYWEDLLKADELKTKRTKLRERNRPQKRSTESNKRGKNL